jgi:hypothetical protein
MYTAPVLKEYLREEPPTSDIEDVVAAPTSLLPTSTPEEVTFNLDCNSLEEVLAGLPKLYVEKVRQHFACSLPECTMLGKSD